jgi:multidrug resistance protein MdtO
MAASVSEPQAESRLRWLELLKSSPERLEFTTRLALICTLSMLVAEIYQTPDAALTAYIAFFLNKPERTESIILSIALAVVITVVIGIVFLVAQWVIDDPMWRVISITLISFGVLFLASASKLRPVGGTMALIIGYALDLLGMIQSGELATRALLYAWLFVGIPAGVGIVVNLFLGPSPRRAAEEALEERRGVCDKLLKNPDDVASRARLSEFLSEGVVPIFTQLKMMAIEKAVPAAQIATLRKQTLSSWGLINALYLRRAQHPEPEGEMPPPEKEAGGFFLPDAFTNPEHVRFAVKITLAAVFCYVLYSLLDWPGIHTCFLTVYIVAQTTAAESVEKLSLRIAGCLLGAAAGYAAIVYLMPNLTSVGGLMIAVFVGAWGAAYVAAGSPRISYAGFQIAFAFFLCVIQGPSPKFDLTVARDRVIGILVGNVVAYLAIVHVWPSTITKRIDPGFAGALKRLARLADSKNPTERLVLSAQAQSTLTEVETDIDLARYEPAEIRAPATWLAERKEAVEEIRVLGTKLLIEADAPAASRLEALTAQFAGRPGAR